ncbi:Uncharacterized conserved protein [uncultured Roseburia sp.]|uniref:NAD(+)/NADH kinase n=1 Tax=Brotonthovivens ammoniilytica TaxID=2981725 RepID=A0ABT2TJQ1_9FIRM|nr:NAD(+)/NADH kinase [Brotonthovivens ammoniilytica]MCU6762420.1 NAD(+)/NADH kinase [Brotonthovivens ammoniilytica]SCI71104.1 Uncharacterized conserved protein [uncultured Roseburia sp.]
MGLIAIAANPASGRDIRRLVSSATVFNNREKQNIMERIILAASQFGDHRFCIMPEKSYFAQKINAHLKEDLKLIPEGMVFCPDLPCSDSQKDTTAFAEYARQQGADVLIVLGGDGTSRAAAKGMMDLPLISISTGTNNVFPEVSEGTAAGIAAAAIAQGIRLDDSCFERCKQIEVSVNGTFCDIALIDAVFSDTVYSGAKAIWSREDISRVMVTQCHPSAIGFSAILGCTLTVSPQDNWGALADCGIGTPNLKVSLAAGTITPVQVTEIKKIPLNESVIYKMEKSGMLALDGEREVKYSSGDEIELCIRRCGPVRVKIARTLEAAQKQGFFVIS